jgi:hypothetical protein
MGISPMYCGTPQYWPVLRPRKQERSDPYMSEPNLHQNNAAEWLIWLALWPVARVMRWWEYLRRDQKAEVERQPYE